MKSVVQIFNELEEIGSRLEKDSILKKNKDNDLLRDAFKAALDPYIVYYVNKLSLSKIEKTSNRSEDEQLKDFLDFISTKLSTRQLTGNAAKQATSDLISSMTPNCAKWAQRILLRNLRCGVQDSSVNKVWPGLIVKFSCSLAQTVDASVTENDFELQQTLQYPVRVEPKLDGLRCIVIKRNGAVIAYTRNGTILDTIPKILTAIENAPIDNVVLDGECMGEDWNESASVLMSSKNKKDDSNIGYYVFDGMSLDEWLASKSKLPLFKRVDFVYDLIKKIDNPKVTQVSGTDVNNVDELREIYETCLDEGFEGVMIKDLTSPYIFKRSEALLKLKPVATYEGTIVSSFNGRDNSRLANKFCGFNILLSNGVISEVGGGFSDVLRAEIALNGIESYVGKIVEAEGQPPLTKEGKIRFPVFLRFREESDVDPAVLEAYNEFVQKQG